MAGLQHDKIGPFMQFVGPGGRRRKLRFTGFGEREALRLVDKVNGLCRCVKYALPLDDELARWVSKLDGDIATRLVEFGLLQPREPIVETPAPAVLTLGPFLDAYTAKRTDVKGATSTFYGHTRRNLLTYFGADRELPKISAGDADEFRLWLLRPTAKDASGGEGLSENTANRRCVLASQFFRAAVRKGSIASNPFEGVGGQVRSNKARAYFLTREDADKVLAACPTLEWKLIFALSRFGGLRTPSEHLGLRLNEIDWARDRFLVHSPKTEHHSDGAERWVPIFPELMPLLREAFETAAPGTEYLIGRHRNNANLRTQFQRIIRRAGLTPWPKLFHNLRASRQTELAGKFPLHVVCSWLGNKAAVAAEHYLQVTDADFTKASAEVVQSGAFLVQSRTLSDAPQSSSDDAYRQKRREIASVAIHGVHGSSIEWAIQDSNL